MPENEAIKISDKILGTGIRTIGAKAAIKLGQAEVPFLALPIISNLFSFVVNKVAEWLYLALENYVAFKIIDTQIAAELKEYSDTSIALKTMLLNRQNYHITEIEEAIKRHKNALQKLISYNGHA